MLRSTDRHVDGKTIPARVIISTVVWLGCLFLNITFAVRGAAGDPVRADVKINSMNEGPPGITAKVGSDQPGVVPGEPDRVYRRAKSSEGKL